MTTSNEIQWLEIGFRRMNIHDLAKAHLQTSEPITGKNLVDEPIEET
jgi:hypothetical protein